jgi:hypothetical protein
MQQALKHPFLFLFLFLFLYPFLLVVFPLQYGLDSHFKTLE